MWTKAIVAVVVGLGMVACGGAAVGPVAAAPAAPAAEPAKSPFRVHIGEAHDGLRTGDLGRAAAALAAAEHEATTPADRDLLVLYRAVLAAYSGDTEAASATLRAHLAGGTMAADSPLRFTYHNSLVLLRVARRDLLGALVECDQMIEAGQVGPWTADADGRRFIQLKKQWHRAYLLRLVAAMSTGVTRDAALRYAEDARTAFRALTAGSPDDSDANAVLDAFFAVHAGDPAGALAAARRVNVGANTDAEDLYLTWMAFELGGDAAAGAAVRERIGHIEDVSFAVPIVKRWMASDAAAGTHAWSPRFVDGQL